MLKRGGCDSVSISSNIWFIRNIERRFTKHYPKSVISVMMITTFIFEQMLFRFEGTMGFHCNRKTGKQMTKR